MAARRTDRIPSPVTVTVTVPGLARSDVINALIDQAIALEAEAAVRKRSISIARSFLVRASRLRDLAAEVRA